ncbi:MAG: hypothetical protein GXY54_08530 [Deltaproteobacteria bacterium]|nr:hypothetical protein [Deltaproteobacteria bacterium]
MEIVERIRREHHESLITLRTIAQTARQMEKGAPLKVEPVLNMVASVLDFNTHCHHFKEEKLFQVLALKLDEDDITLLMELEAEHKAANELLKSIHRQIRETVPQIPLLKSRVVETLWTFVELSRRHMDKEEKQLFPRLEGILQEAERIRLLEYFEPSPSPCSFSDNPPAGVWSSKEL